MERRSRREMPGCCLKVLLLHHRFRADWAACMGIVGSHGCSGIGGFGSWLSVIGLKKKPNYSLKRPVGIARLLVRASGGGRLVLVLGTGGIVYQVFLKGLVFGLGLVVALSLSYGVYRVLSGFTLNPAPAATPSESQASDLDRTQPDFSDLSIEERIARSSVIFVARFEDAPDGKQRAIISEVLKRDDGAVFPFGLGDMPLDLFREKCSSDV